MITRFLGTVYPDKNFSIGAVPKPKKRRQDSQYEIDRANVSEYDLDSHINWLTGVNSVEGKFNSISESPLFIKAPKSSPEKRGKYGTHGITRFGRRACKNICLLLEKEHTKSRLGFGTCTLPAVEKETLSVIIGNWGDITRRFYQKNRRLYKKRGAEFKYVGVAEIQEKRFAETGMPVPHLHFVYVAKANKHNGYTLNVKDFYTAWNEAVNEVLVLKGQLPVMGINGHKGSVKVEAIRSSASAYIGKYISKGSVVVKAMQEAGYKEFPKQWWSACRACKEMFKKALIRLNGKTCEAIFYGVEHYLHEKMITWARFVDVEIGGVSRTIGLVGVMSEFMYASMQI